MRVLPFATYGASEFTSLGASLLEEAVAAGVAYLAAGAITGPAVLLGAAQRAERVLDLDACARERVAIARRVTGGTAMYVGKQSLGFALALPKVNALAADATLRTLVNRNVRGFLKGLTSLGALAHYFGREWIAVQHRPIALIGTTHDERGAALIEVVVGIDSPVVLPSALATPLEQRLDRYQGKQPITLNEATAKRPALDATCARFVSAFAARYGAPVDRVESLSARSRETVNATPPDGFVANEPVHCAIGYIDAAWSPTRDALWLGGDAWAPPHVLRAVADAIRTDTLDALEVEDGAIEGARIEDFVLAARGLSGNRG